jgi:hypothetical protein
MNRSEQVVTEDHPVFGAILTLGNPVVVPDKAFTIQSAPVLGQHTDEVLGRARLRRERTREAAGERSRVTLPRKAVSGHIWLLFFP